MEDEAGPISAKSVAVSVEDVPASAIDERPSANTPAATHVGYENVINFPRAIKGAAQSCVMCGAGAGHGGVTIPRQNKDVCRDCDKCVWRHEPTGAYFKWCKGCKNFLHVGTFHEKLDAAKCDRCRERGRNSYLLKKRSAGGTPKASRSRASSYAEPEESTPVDSAGAEALMAVAKAGPEPDDDEDDRMSSNFGCSLLQYQRKRSRSESIVSECPSEAPSEASRVPGPDDDDDEAAASAAAESAAGEGESTVLLELANIHATIVRLEHRAGMVEPLEQKIAELEAQLRECRTRETRLAAELERKSAESRPRNVSFDEKQKLPALPEGAERPAPLRPGLRSSSK